MPDTHIRLVLAIGVVTGLFFYFTIPYQYVIPVCLAMGGLAGWFLAEYYRKE